MIKQCRKCKKDFEATGYQIKKSDYVCQQCKKKYDEEWRTKRLSLGLPAYGSRNWDEEKKIRWFKEYYSNPENKKKIAERMRKYRKDPELRAKMEARWFTKRMVRTGKIQSLPCSFCGSEKSQVHHIDYTKPLLIVWVCRKCHSKIHPRTKESWKYAKAEGKDTK